MVLKSDPWAIVQAEADALPPFLEDNELTIERFYERNKDKLSKSEAKAMLNRMVAPDGPLKKQERRRRGKSGRVIVYVVKGTK